ncbi:PREDICTED: 2-acylglycerol O-acyltransferase 2-like [Sturnus vulgaris]|uniref:2-acylglycerol O-acyltransferase 2-like n=1 Tax=Sturnus vulgaris TaxID=9172 RepID=UPI00071A66CE|nr:PREDICTED: 2-acylglycerol O-acyltransferase 2-like [Sturnus vulgaris]
MSSQFLPVTSQFIPVALSSSQFIPLCTLLFVLALRGPLWLPALLYGLWLLADRDTPRRGGRPCAWVRAWPVWKHFRDYFPISLIRTTPLDPGRNYIFGFHPHGVLAAGAFGNFCTEATGFGLLFPGLRPHLLTLPCWFRLPLFRDYAMAGGLVSSEPSSLEHLLAGEGGGRVAVIALGGPPESLEAQPGALRLQLLTPLVPVFSFGENEGNFGVPKGEFWGSQMGAPLELPRVPNPSGSQVELWHRRYRESLERLFEEHKEGFGVPPERHLSFV